MTVKKRPNSPSISGKKETIVKSVPESKRPLSVESIETIDTPLAIRVDQDFGVAACLKDMAQSLQFLSQLKVIEDLAIEHDPVSTIMTTHRLLAGSQINDAQPEMPETNPFGQQETCLV